MWAASEDTDMNLKKLITSKIVKEATGKLLPMEDPTKKIGVKAKIAALLAAIAAAATAGSQLLGG